MRIFLSYGIGFASTGIAILALLTGEPLNWKLLVLLAFGLPFLWLGLVSHKQGKPEQEVQRSENQTRLTAEAEPEKYKFEAEKKDIYKTNNIEDALEKLESRLSKIDSEAEKNNLERAKSHLKKTKQQVRNFSKSKKNIQKIYDFLIEKDFPHFSNIELTNVDFRFQIQESTLVHTSQRKYVVETNENGTLCCQITGTEDSFPPPGFEEDANIYPGLNHDEIDELVEFNNLKELISFLMNIIETSYSKN